MDAIVASGLLILLAFFITGFSFQISNEDVQVKQIFYKSKDINHVLREAKISDLQDYSIVQQYLADGSLTVADFNVTLIEMVGFWWATGNVSRATNLTKEIVDSLVGNSTFGYEILFGNTTIYQKNKSVEKLLLKTTAVVSGFELGRQPKGYVASAFATGVNKNTTMVFDFNPEGSGKDQGKQAVITKKFYLNSSEISSITNAVFYASIHTGQQDLSSQDFEINGNDLSLTVLNESEKVINGDTTRLIFGYQQVPTTYFNLPGWNTITIELKGDVDWHSHIHPGFRLELNVKVNETSIAKSFVENTTHYFDNILSEATGSKNSGVWSIFPFYIPQGAEVHNVILFLRAKDVNNISQSFIPGSEKSNIRIYLNNLTVNLTNPPSQNQLAQFDMNFTYNLTLNVSTGTNIISVYFNAYGDDIWGLQNTQLYSDPENDPKGSSFVRVEYKKTENELRHGKIEVGIKEAIIGPHGNPKIYEKGFNGSELSKAFVHLAQLDTDNVTINVSNAAGLQTAFHSPRPYATPTNVFIDPTILSVNENNTFNLSDYCTVLCDFLNYSSFEYFTWIPSLVGYGDVFANSSAATEDARARLNALLGQYADITNIENDTQSIPEIPTLWGPAKMEIRVWL